MGTTMTAKARSKWYIMAAVSLLYFWFGWQLQSLSGSAPEASSKTDTVREKDDRETVQKPQEPGEPTVVDTASDNKTPRQSNNGLGQTVDDNTTTATAIAALPATNENDSTAGTKYILYYNKFWSYADFSFGFGREPFEKHCPHLESYNCVATNDRSQLSSLGDFDAVVIHGLQFQLTPARREEINSWRKQHQRFVYFMTESPVYDGYGWLSKYKDFFNWTMSYRIDSDIHKPYGSFELKSEMTNTVGALPRIHRDGRWPVVWDGSIATKNNTSLMNLSHLAQRPNKVAWIVSNCRSSSKREEFVKELKKHIRVDQFGKCGGTLCNKRYSVVNDDDCSSIVEKDYKFYLALENAFTDDYVTEKFFLRASRHSLPIVFGQANYSVVAPPHSYINALDFGSVRELAEYIQKVDEDDDLYMSYFWWHEHYYVNITLEHTARSFCRLCGMLHDPSLPSKRYIDFEQWWRHDAHLGADREKAFGMMNQTLLAALRDEYFKGMEEDPEPKPNVRVEWPDER